MATNIYVSISLEDGAEPSALETRILKALGGDVETVTEKVGDVSVTTTRTASVEEKPAEEAPKAEEPTEEPTEEKPKRKRRTKAQIEADRKAEEAAKAAAEEPEEDDEPEEAPEEAAKAAEVEKSDDSEVDEKALRDKARKAAVKYINENGKEDLEEVLSQFGAKRLPEVPLDKIDDFIEMLEL